MCQFITLLTLGLANLGLAVKSKLTKIASSVSMVINFKK
ncbi:hypothetical protein CNR480_03383 [Klebsiella pneumoniae]|nr:hypothetical protein CNR480_03383 [Klebsiella pneumoniae]